MARLILLDSTPLGLACNRPGTPAVDACRAWLTALEAAGAEVLIPAVAAYETRRKLAHIAAAAKLRNLDALRTRFDYLDVAAAAWDRAADLWGLMRRQGTSTAAPEGLDVDCIIAGMALTVGQPGDTVTVATRNVGHFHRFPGVDARDWWTIT